MLEAVSLLGRVLAEDDRDIVADLVQEVRRPPRVERVYLVKLDFRDDGLAADLEEVGAGTALRYRWVGNASGNNPQMFLTTNKLFYLVGPSPANLAAALERAGLDGTALYRNLVAILNRFFGSLPDGTRVLDVEALGWAAPGTLKQWCENKRKAREVLKLVAGVVQDRVLSELGVTAKEVVLWTVCFRGEPLVADEAYDRAILHYKEAAFAEAGAGTSTGTCSVCGARDRRVSHDLARLDFLKYYITDKLGFASGVSEAGFARNFLVCGACFRGLLVAERYARQRLNVRVGPLNFLVLPAFLAPVDLERRDAEGWAARLHTRVSALADTAGWLESIGGDRGLEAELADLVDELPHENVALLNFLFYQKSQSELRVLRLVKDVAPGRISHLLRSAHRLANRAGWLLGEDRRWWLDLTRICRLVPLRTGRGVEHKNLLHIYEALLTGRPVGYDFLLAQFLALARVYLTGQFEGTNLRRPGPGYEEVELAFKLLQANLLLKLFREENLLEGGMSLREQLEVHVEGPMRDYLVEMQYSGPQAALFLLGYLIGEVGKGQFRAGHEGKPVLEKINYQGLSWQKVMQLSNEIVERLRQYDRLRYNERLYAEMKRLLDAHRHDWPLSPQENTFYILSGYAYGIRAAARE
ncbi:MAG: TIGR02556 family CRISPR-associated protein [Desulfotomaculales bacterium]